MLSIVYLMLRSARRARLEARGAAARLSARPAGVADRHAAAHILLDAVLRERVAQPVLGQRLHPGDGLGEIVGWQCHQHLVVEHPAVAALGEAWDRQARRAGLERAAPGIRARRFADDTPVEALVARPLQAIDEVDHGPRRRVKQRDVGWVE